MAVNFSEHVQYIIQRNLVSLLELQDATLKPIRIKKNLYGWMDNKFSILRCPILFMQSRS